MNVDAYEGILKFVILMDGDLGWIPVAIAVLVLALALHVVQKIRGEI